MFDILLLNPTINVLLLFYYFFITLHIPGAFGFAVIALTTLVRILTHPFYSRQMSLAAKMEAAKPKIDELSKLHEHDKKKLQEEQLKLYQEMGINPAAGCVLAVLQIPLFIALYETIRKLVSIPDSALVATLKPIVYFDFLKITSIDPMFFGFNLFVKPSDFQTYGWYYLLIPVLTAILQFVQFQVTAPKPAPKVEGKEPDMSSVMTSQMKFMFPIMIGYFSFILPVGLAVYWNVFSIFSLLQHKAMKKGEITK